MHHLLNFELKIIVNLYNFLDHTTEKKSWQKNQCNSNKLLYTFRYRQIKSFFFFLPEMNQNLNMIQLKKDNIFLNQTEISISSFKSFNDFNGICLFFTQTIDIFLKTTWFNKKKLFWFSEFWAKTTQCVTAYFYKTLFMN